MTLLALPITILAPLLLANLLGGLLLGWLYFGLIWRSARLFAQGGGLRLLLLTGLGRLAALALALLLAALEGALPLLVVAAGMLIARALYLRRVRRQAP